MPTAGDLSRPERWMLRHFCYNPPRPRRAEVVEAVPTAEEARRFVDRAFGAETLELVKGARVIDVGCGVGASVMALSELASFAVGIDTSTRVALGRAGAQDEGLSGLGYVQGTLDCLRPDSFDVVLSHDAFEHFDDPSWMLSEMTRVLRPGGQIVIKFGPTWMGPWGRHMSGTFRKSRPWIHLLVPERSMMRIWSVYQDWPTLLEEYRQLPGGLNKMTVRRCERIFEQERRLRVERIEIYMWRGLPGASRVVGVRELLSHGLRVIATRL